MGARAASTLRCWSVSSMRSRYWPPRPRENSQLNSAVRTPPMCRNPVGLGANRVRGEEVVVMGWSGDLVAGGGSAFAVVEGDDAVGAALAARREDHPLRQPELHLAWFQVGD